MADQVDGRPIANAQALPIVLPIVPPANAQAIAAALPALQQPHINRVQVKAETTKSRKIESCKI